MITLKVYGDESADETKTRVFAVAAVIGTEDEWQPAVREWLRRNRGLEFKASACETQYSKEAEPEKHLVNLKLYEDMTTILAQSHLVGLSVALDLRSQQALLPGIDPDIGYYKCFTDLLVNAAQIARSFNNDPREPDDVQLEFVFDSRLQSNGTAGNIYTVFGNLPEWKHSRIFDTKVTFDGGPNPRLEMADLVAREAMKELDRKVTRITRHPRLSFQALTATEQFVWIERDRAHCEEWRDKVQSVESQADFEQYKEWLTATGRVQSGRPHDNMTNRVLFYAWQEHREAINGKSGA